MPVKQRELRASWGPDGRPRLAYRTELPGDRDLQDVLWARCPQRRGPDGLPTGDPQWRDVHPARQRECMQRLLCQVCAQPARTPKGFVFLIAPGELKPGETTLLTAQPPVCRRHTRTAAALCPYLREDPTVLLVPAPRLHGVVGALYEPAGPRIRPAPVDLGSLPYGHPFLRWYLASQMVRRLHSFEVIELKELADGR
ncbi:hypothetical protein IAG44_12675 [Streptomyces roseirectus]|uniref:Uncharacterized protein n=1 Tax=Streptomyces roseirectus TaxID=2768066 RepID=A0A7H0IBQ3_9ACTN|nr:hypothetical protein [Streptomyces roseirectus]QNP70219.1 hypothetical protein IAG44_12675 [Streptomyces roseirectus]